MNQEFFENMDLTQLGKYIEEQQINMLMPSIENTVGKGITKFRLCGVGPMDMCPGFELWLDSDIVNTIAAGSSISAAIATFIPDPTISKVVAVFLGTLSAIFAKAAAEGSGIFIRGAFLPSWPWVTPIMVCYQ